MATDAEASGHISNVRPKAIFTGYMLLCLLLSILIIQDLTRKYYSSSLRIRQVRVWYCFALLSLVTTWFFMFAFFVHSYRSWAASMQMQQKFFYGHDAENLQLGAWLRDTKLFREAWGTVVMTPARLFWSQPIFFFAAGWGVFLGRQGEKRGIPFLWAYMLLGQIVAISFATSLFFVAVLLYPPLPTSKTFQHSKDIVGPWALHTIAVYGTIGSVLIIPLSTASSYFLPLLAIPHVLLLLFPIVHAVVPRSWPFRDDNGIFPPEQLMLFYRELQWVLVGAAGVRQAMVVLQVLLDEHDLLRIRDALWEHPAVTSVGWDVIWCCIVWSIWWRTQAWDVGYDYSDGVTGRKER